MEIIIQCSDNVRGGKNIFGEPIEEIVRCKECKRWRATNSKPIRMCTMTGSKVNPDDFCSYGERSDNE